MLDDITAWVALRTLIKLERQRVGSELTQEMLLRSREQLARSDNLLQVNPPKVWHPEPPK
jgi:hypothetical protein